MWFYYHLDENELSELRAAVVWFSAIFETEHFKVVGDFFWTEKTVDCKFLRRQRVCVLLNETLVPKISRRFGNSYTAGQEEEVQQRPKKFVCPSASRLFCYLHFSFKCFKCIKYCIGGSSSRILLAPVPSVCIVS